VLELGEEDVVAAPAEALLELVLLPQPVASAATARATTTAPVVDDRVRPRAMIRAPY
jgi:hypothetical protein